jgi:hypothetical protein
MKHVLRRISSFRCFSVRKSAKLSIITPKIKLSVIIITMKKNIMSYITRKKYSGSLKKEYKTKLFLHHLDRTLGNSVRDFFLVSSQNIELQSSSDYTNTMHCD